jgi:sarcosine oxidase gamma subunit
MSQPTALSATPRAWFVVLHEVGPGQWQVIGEVPRRAGLAARAARVRAVREAIGGEPSPGATYAAVLRSEWRIAAEL